MFDWAVLKDAPMQESLAQQKDYVRAEFERRMQQAVLALNEQGLNVALYWANPDPRKYVNIVPTSAITGEGVRNSPCGVPTLGTELNGVLYRRRVECENACKSCRNMRRCFVAQLLIPRV